ncbi:UDP-glucosyltransferase 2-like [Bradysia coprophila]|uniref:UDP-glucosyltransferase 2-like n=1 Tax=Bradysia coprophila TaxID=38358 RepID=UPI00187D9175|nr:UDP-glucosyltransferase 2-like [Bradysia coprophila]
MRALCITVITCIWLLSLSESVDGAKILSFSFMSSKSHKITYEPLLRELARRGHQVTVLSPIASKNETNFVNIPTVDPDLAFGSAPNFFEMKQSMSPLITAIFNPFLMMRSLMTPVCQIGYALPIINKVLEEKWDLVFFTPLFNECLYGLVHKLNTSTVLYTQTTVPTWIADNLGSPNPPSYVSSMLVGYEERMSLWERMFNCFRTVFDWIVMNWFYFPRMEAIYRDAFNDPQMPGIKEIERNASILLMNSQISFSSPRPYLPDLIEVGGLHLVPAKPVQPKELDDFLNGGKDGFILFSMGSALQGVDMPENYRKLFLGAFSKLKQRVIWKWETEEMDDLPPNVKLSKWLPQQDVLGHKNIKLFLTHGGFGSTMEALYHGVPLVGIPMLGDQPSNMKKAEKKGFAIPLDFNTLTEEILLNAINKAINDPSYRQTVKKLSSVFLDQMEKPLDRAVFWIEYVLRHHGAVHLRSAARELNYFQYFSVDVFVIFVAIIVIDILILRAILKKCFSSKSKPGASKKKKAQ